MNKILFFLILMMLPFSTAYADQVVNLGATSPFTQTEPGIYTMLAPLGGLIGKTVNLNDGGLGTYLNQLFRMGIIVATALAIIMITVGGLKYASTDAINGKSEGKEMIQQALLGLVLALMSVVLLQQINPELLKSDLDLGEGIDISGSAINTSNIRLRNDGGQNRETNPSGGGAQSADGGVGVVGTGSVHEGNTEGPRNTNSSNNTAPSTEPPLPTRTPTPTNAPNPLLPQI